MKTRLSIVVPVYRNEEAIPELLATLARIALQARTDFRCCTEVVFVVDGSPDNSYSLLEQSLMAVPFTSQLILHSRNFGSFAAIRTGLRMATGEYFCVLAADLQEPPELPLLFLDRLLTHQYDVAVGCREYRNDPLLSRSASRLFWSLYRKFVIRDIPKQGVDVFGCNKTFRDHLVSLGEANSSLVGLVYWLGFRRCEVFYERRARLHGKSAWTLAKKSRYLADSIFSFTDLPIKLLSIFGVVGVLSSIFLGTVVLLAKLYGQIPVPGYAATVLVLTFFGGLNSLGLGVIGSYAWRAYENTKCRPLGVVMAQKRFDGAVPPEE